MAQPPVPNEPDAGQPPIAFDVGHFYSPMYDARTLVSEPARSRIWPSQPREQPGINWNAAGQRTFLRDVLAAQHRMEFPRVGDPNGDHYFMSNGQFPSLDAWVLEGMLRHLRPRQTIEVGGGFSSLVTARVNREYLGTRMSFTCIDPYPRGFLTRGVAGLTRLVVQRVEETPLSIFETLTDGDVLFIDTSHTVRTGGDVVWLFGQVLPRLQTGVHVHIHDVFLPGDYPEEWVRDGRGWNENYLVEAFLQFNTGFDVVLGVQWALVNAHDDLLRAVPGLADPGGSLWLRRA